MRSRELLDGIRGVSFFIIQRIGFMIVPPFVIERSLKISSDVPTNATRNPSANQVPSSRNIWGVFERIDHKNAHRYLISSRNEWPGNHCVVVIIISVHSSLQFNSHFRASYCNDFYFVLQKNSWGGSLKKITAIRFGNENY